MSLGEEVAVAFSLVLILEGILPFLYPQRWRHLAARLAEMDNASLRLAGLFSMLLGTGLLYLIR